MNQQANRDLRRKAYVGILLMGVVSLIGDIVYEGSRGIVPGYLALLGATEITVGIVGGLGDFLGNAMRLVSGVLADSTRAYWVFIFLGYGLIGAIPFLGVSFGLGMAIVLVLLERLGKALRAPSRDTVISIVSKEVGTGKAFGFHELLDQIGGMLGPLIVSALMLYSSNDYRCAFSFLFVPFLALLVVLAYTYRRINSRTAEARRKETEERETGMLAKSFYVYTLAVLLNAAGLISYALILFRANEIVLPTQQWIVPLIYLLIQGVDAPAALLAGYAYDRFGTRLLVVPFLLSLFPSLLTILSAELTMLVVASIVFGVVLGMQESVYRAAVSDLTPISSRGKAYGIFNTAYGVGFLVSGAVFGLLLSYKTAFYVPVSYVLLMQIPAIALLLNLRSGKEKKREG